MSRQVVVAGEFEPRDDGGAAEREGAIGLAKRGWRAWKRLARRAGNLQARGIFNLAFFVLIAPIALAARMFARHGDSSLRHPSGGWKPHPDADDGDPMVAARRQF
jgi:hypothetical protein